MRWLAKFTPDEQKKIVDDSVRQGYQGLFELKESGNGTHRKNGEPRLSAVERVYRATEPFIGGEPNEGDASLARDG